MPIVTYHPHIPEETAQLLVGLIRYHVTGSGRSPAKYLQALAQSLEAGGVTGWDAAPDQGAIHFSDPDELPGLQED